MDHLHRAPWPAPDEARSAYTIAYLSMAAKTNLAAVIANVVDLISADAIDVIVRIKEMATPIVVASSELPAVHHQ